MPPAESLLIPAAAPPVPVARRRLHGWGGGPAVSSEVLSPWREQDVATAVRRARERGVQAAIPRGMGRSYGDAAQRRDGVVLDTLRLKSMWLDAERGVVTAQAGVTIGELLDRCAPRGWTVPVVPGTQHVSLGGAIASDIHGKNHGTVGTFGTHVEALGLVGSDGELIEVGRDEPLMRATTGGMGLTGVIVWARLRLRRARTSLLSVDTDRVVGLEATLDALRAEGGPHRVAWLDLLSRRPRAVVTRATELDAPPAGAPPAAPTVPSRAVVPERWPRGLVRVSTIRAFNDLRFRMSPQHGRDHLESFGSHMFPLDALDAWPRLYGPRGFVQYQLAVGPDRVDALEGVLGVLRRYRVPCYLAVLKDFGPANDAPLSFPLEGWTLALDLPRAAPGLLFALDACDEIVAGAGGRVYLAKDARMRPEILRAMYPRLTEWQHLRDDADPERLWASDLALRAGLIEP